MTTSEGRTRDHRGDRIMSTTNERIAELEATCDRLAASVVLLAHEAHPVYGSTAGWRGGIGGQAMTQGCSIIDPPPGADWAQYDLPTSVARDWLRERDVDLAGVMANLKAEWLDMLKPTTNPPADHEPAPEAGASGRGLDSDERDEMACVGCGASVLDEGGDETLGWLGGDEGWFCPTCCTNPDPASAEGEVG